MQLVLFMPWRGSSYEVVWADGDCILVAGTNRIDRFQRVPSDLRKYLAYTAQIKLDYGSVMRFVVKERLGWGDGNAEDLKPKGRPFEFDGMILQLGDAKHAVLD